MNRAEWAKYHGFDENDMERIDYLKSAVGGTITGVFIGKGDFYAKREANRRAAEKRISENLAQRKYFAN